jgi:hypothetical protein
MPFSVQNRAGHPTVSQSADIVFLVDSSASMSPVFEGLKNHIKTFVNELSAGGGAVDYRLCFLAAGIASFRYSHFTDSVPDFVAGLKKTTTESDEYTLPALDFVFDFDWRERAHKIVVLFTDEPVQTGHDPTFQRSQLDQLIDKARALKTRLFFFTPQCPSFSRICREVPHAFHTIVEAHEDLLGADFGDVLKQLGASVSSSIAGAGNPQLLASVSVSRDLYGLSRGSRPAIKLIR